MANGTAVAKAQQKELKELLFSRTDEFSQALAGRLNPDAYLRAAYTSVTKNTALQECSTASIMMAVLEAASLGLQLHGSMGEAYLVAYNTKVGNQWQKQAQLQVGYRGLVKLAVRSGSIVNVVPRPVYEGEEFRVVYGTAEDIEHTPNFDGDRSPGKLKYVYATAFFSDGRTNQFEVMTRDEVEKIRARSKSADRGPWKDDYTEMALKTVVRRLCKRLPLSDMELARALELDNEQYDVEGTASSAPKRGAAALRERLKQQQEEIEDAEYEVVGEQPQEATAKAA